MDEVVVLRVMACVFFLYCKNFMQLVQWIHEIAKANSMIVKKLTKLFNVLILGDETMSKLF